MSGIAALMLQRQPDVLADAYGAVSADEAPIAQAATPPAERVSSGGR